MLKDQSILHIVDDEKFIDAAINSFNEINSNANYFLILRNGSGNVLKYIKRVKDVNIIDINDRNLLFDFISNKNIAAIAIHYLAADKLKLFTALKIKFPNLKFIWFFWGADGYSLPKLKYELYQKKTNSLVRKLTKSTLKKIVFYCLELLAIMRIFPEEVLPSVKLKRSFIKQVDFIVPVIPEDFELLNLNYKLKAHMLEWNYLSVQHMLSGVNVRIKGENILLGNSSDPSNNHIEMIDRLSKIDLGDRKVYVPLSYGDSIYREAIIKYGGKLLGDNFIPLTNFMPLNEYTNIISSCNYVIMNHNRQQAMGNILVSLYMGAKLFINRNSTMYDFFKRKNIVFYDIDILNGPLNLAFQPLTVCQQKKNKKLLNEIVGSEIIKEKTKRIIDILLSN